MLLNEHITESIVKAWNHESRLPPETMEVPGRTSPKIRHLLNNLCSLPDTVFLEIGSAQGASYISAMAGNEDTVIKGMAIDNWCQYGTPIDAYSGTEKAFDENTARFLAGYGDRWHKIKQDLFTVTSLPATPNIFYYDARHDQTSIALPRFFPLIADPCIVALDGWGLKNERAHFVQLGWRQAVAASKWEVASEWELPSYRYKDTDFWWEGFYVCVLTKGMP